MTVLTREERRQHARVPVYLPIQFRRRSGELQLVETLIKDLSLGGLRCVSPVVLPPGTEVYVELPLEAGHEPVGADGRIVWIQPLPKSELYHLGIAFHPIQAQIERRLSTYLERCSRHLASA